MSDACLPLLRRLPLRVAASTAPAALQVFWNGTPLQTREVAGEEGTVLMACLEGWSAARIGFSGAAYLALLPSLVAAYWGARLLPPPRGP